MGLSFVSTAACALLFESLLKGDFSLLSGKTGLPTASGILTCSIAKEWKVQTLGQISSQLCILSIICCIVLRNTTSLSLGKLKSGLF